VRRLIFAQAGLAVIVNLTQAGCGQRAKADWRIEEPPSAEIVHQHEGAFVTVDHAEQFPVVTAVRYGAVSEISATGVVSADISRNVPVISLASGRVVEIDARLGDEVRKGQLLLRLQSSDIAQAFSDYRKAVTNKELTQAQLDRATALYSKGAIAAKDLEVARNADATARVDVETTAERLRLLGSELDHPTGTVNIYAPVSGVITDQQITASGGVQALSGPNPFTISDLSHVWIICDVYENNLSQVHLNESADVHLVAYPNRVLKGIISNIGPVLDAATRAAKVRVEIANPGILRLGMFVSATFHRSTMEAHTAVPASAILHLHDQDWVYVPQGANRFRRVEVEIGRVVPPNWQEILSGVQPGNKVVANALELQNASEQ
jgi:membrane fusion protein, heavy metal efflux system